MSTMPDQRYLALSLATSGVCEAFSCEQLLCVWLVVRVPQAASISMQQHALCEIHVSCEDTAILHTLMK